MVIPVFQAKTSHSNLLEEILQYFTEEQVMEIYLGRSPSTTLFCNPFRVDNNPSCSLNWYKGKLILKDWSLGWEYSLVDVAGLKFGLIDPFEDTRKATGKYSLIVYKMYEELVKGKELPKIENKHINTKVSEVKKVEVVLRKWDKYDLDYWELPPDVLEKHHIYPILYGLINGDTVMYSSVECPTYAYYFPEYSTNNHRVWKIYSPKAKLFPNKPKWLGNVKSDMIFKTF